MSDKYARPGQWCQTEGFDGRVVGGLEFLVEVWYPGVMNIEEVIEVDGRCHISV